MKNILGLNIWAQIISFPFIILMILMLVSTIAGYDEKGANIDQEVVLETIEKYVVQCYASEGSYPPDLNYLAKNYGLILNEDRYIYEYDIFASNIMPDISVIEIADQ